MPLRRGSGAARSAPSTPDPAIAARQAAAAGTKAAGRAVAAAAERVKTPLLVGGATAAGVVGGLAIKNRTRRSGLGGRLRSLPVPIRDGQLDLDAIASAARSVGAVGQQVGDIAAALKRAQK